MKIVAVIPAHMASVRFPGKILFPFYGLPMIEHVRRRALMSTYLSDVVVATCDDSIASTIRGFGGEVVLTDNTHKNGTTRTAEAVQSIDCTHVILLQGDEPLLLPRHIDAIAKAICTDQLSKAWNATGPIDQAEELDRNSFVKCVIGKENRILYYFRRSPCYSSYEKQQTFVRKVLGIIAYRKDFLIDLLKLPQSKIEQAEFIEQMRIIEHGYTINSINVSPSLPSVNIPEEAELVYDFIKNNQEQQDILRYII
jgi:3-deoxy-manno-octulosonate cytidylyltransferase (CMP-KDO synthetase)